MNSFRLLVGNPYHKEEHEKNNNKIKNDTGYSIVIPKMKINVKKLRRVIFFSLTC